jgi:hypothetical protein
VSLWFFLSDWFGDVPTTLERCSSVMINVVWQLADIRFETAAKLVKEQDTTQLRADLGRFKPMRPDSFCGAGREHPSSPAPSHRPKALKTRQLEHSTVDF